MAENSVSVEFSPSWWMKQLTDRQTKKLPRLNELQAWLDNDPPLPETSASWEAAYSAFYKDTRTNVASLAVTSAAHRLTALGFRTGATGDDNGDEKAAQFWSENQMAIESVDLITWMLGLSESYLMVGPPRDGEESPIFTAEDPRSVITANNPMRRMEVRAGMKTLHDPDKGEDICVIYVPADPERYDPSVATAYTARRKSKLGTQWGPNFHFDGRAWKWESPVKLRTKDVPIVRLENRGGVAEFEPHMADLRRINRIILQRMLIGEIQAFRQRAVEGLPDVYPNDFPVPDLRGKKIDYEGVFTPGPGSMWKVPPGAKFWESQPIDLRPLLEEEKLEYRNIAGKIGIPISYISPDDANGSAEGASLQRESQVYRVEDRQKIIEAGLNKGMSLAFETVGDTERAKLSDIETIWAPIERLSLSERYSAASQAKAAGENITTIRREVLKYTPRQMKQAEDDDATAMILAPRPPAAPNPADPQQPAQQPASQPVPAGR